MDSLQKSAWRNFELVICVPSNFKDWTGLTSYFSRAGARDIVQCKYSVDVVLSTYVDSENAGLSNSKGKFTMILSQRDEFSSNYLEYTLWPFYTRRSRLGAVSSFFLIKGDTDSFEMKHQIGANDATTFEFLR